MADGYVHGYTRTEVQRLRDQATALTDLLHFDTFYPAGHEVLEAGCGVGAQTEVLARHSPGAKITAVDISERSLSEAKQLVEAAGIANVQFRMQDVNSLSFESESFDHVFVCFLLEHMADPLKTLLELRRVLKTGGTMTIIEGDHGSACFHPYSEDAQKAIDCLVQLQSTSGGDANIGRTIYPLMVQAGFASPYVTPRIVYADNSRKAMMEGFTRNTFTAMVKEVRPRVAEAKLLDLEIFDRGIRDLYRTAEPGGTFSYTFYKGQAVK